MIQLLIIADDFTGGLDTGVQFAQRGIRTRVVTDPQADLQSAADGAQVLVVVAETRHIPAQEAYAVVRQVVQAGAALGIPYIYKKTDSGLRGNIGAELQAVMDAAGESILAFMPAMPANGRITVEGVHYVNGVPVAESVFGRDPFEPVRESVVTRLLALQTETPAVSVTADELPEGQEGIWVVDARTDEELRRTGERLAALGRLRVMAGCAGFAAVLPELLSLNMQSAPACPALDGGLLVLCGSVNPITQRQLRYAEEHGFARVHILPDQKLTPGYFKSAEGLRTLDGWTSMMTSRPWMILDANDDDDANRYTAAYASARGIDTEGLRRGISTALGDILPAVLRGPKRTLLITGGDTLLQCMNRMGVFDMEPLLEVFPGVVLARFEADGREQLVMTKSGGFGQETLLTDIKARIEAQRANQ